MNLSLPVCHVCILFSCRVDVALYTAYANFLAKVSSFRKPCFVEGVMPTFWSCYFFQTIIGQNEEEDTNIEDNATGAFEVCSWLLTCMYVHMHVCHCNALRRSIQLRRRSLLLGRCSWQAEEHLSPSSMSSLLLMVWYNTTCSYCSFCGSSCDIFLFLVVYLPFVLPHVWQASLSLCYTPLCCWG